MGVITAKIEGGNYKGKTVTVQFGKPLKVLVDGKNIADWVIALRIDLSARGHILYLEIAEGNYSQFPLKESSR